jgi:hypothetical protein
VGETGASTVATATGTGKGTGSDPGSTATSEAGTTYVETSGLDIDTTGGAASDGGWTATTGRPTVEVLDCDDPLDPWTVGLYRMEDVAQETFSDSVGSLDGIFVGATPTTVDGPPGCGQALSIVGAMFAVAPLSTAWQLEEGSIDFWVRLPSPPTDASGLGIISRDASGQEFPGHLTASYLSDGRVVTRLQSSTTEVIRCSEPLDPDTWYFVGINFGPPDLELFIDGVRAENRGVWNTGGTVYTCGEPLEIGLDGNNNPWVIGASAVGSNEGGYTDTKDFFSGGAIDELRLSMTRRPYGL